MMQAYLALNEKVISRRQDRRGGLGVRTAITPEGKALFFTDLLSGYELSSVDKKTVLTKLLSSMRLLNTDFPFDRDPQNAVRLRGLLSRRGPLSLLERKEIEILRLWRIETIGRKFADKAVEEQMKRRELERKKGKEVKDGHPFHEFIPPHTWLYKPSVMVKVCLDRNIVLPEELDCISDKLLVEIFTSEPLLRLLGLRYRDKSASFWRENSIDWCNEKDAALSFRQLISLSDQERRRLDHKEIPALLCPWFDQQSKKHFSTFSLDRILKLSQRQYERLTTDYEMRGLPGHEEGMMPWQESYARILEKQRPEIGENILIFLEKMEDDYAPLSSALKNLASLLTKKEVQIVADFDRDKLDILLAMRFKEKDFLELFRPEQKWVTAMNLPDFGYHVVLPPRIGWNLVAKANAYQMKSLVLAQRAIEGRFITAEEGVNLTHRQARVASILSWIEEIFPGRADGQEESFEKKTGGEITKEDMKQLSPSQALILREAWLTRHEHGLSMAEVRVNLLFIQEAMTIGIRLSGEKGPKRVFIPRKRGRFPLYEIDEKTEISLASFLSKLSSPGQRQVRSRRKAVGLERLAR